MSMMGASPWGRQLLGRMQPGGFQRPAGGQLPQLPQRQGPTPNYAAIQAVLARGRPGMGQQPFGAPQVQPPQQITPRMGQMFSPPGMPMPPQGPLQGGFQLMPPTNPFF
jgi:hypothetical protein